MESIRKSYMRISYAFNQVIDVNEIESVLFTKDTINVGEIPTEDNYYCVPLK